MDHKELLHLLDDAARTQAGPVAARAGRRNARPRVLAIVPARGGSRRLPRKNLAPLDGEPLIGWTLRTAAQSRLFEAVVVSTDDAEIATLAQEMGALVPGLRPAHLSTDTATTAAVLQDVLQRYPGPLGLDAVVLLQPTSPFRRVASLQGAVARFLAAPRAERRPVVSVSPAASHPAWCFTLDGSRMQPMLGWEGLSRRSQDLPVAYALNGAIYVLPPAQVLAGAPILAPGVCAWVMDDPDEAMDIDDATDLRRAEALAPGWRERAAAADADDTVDAGTNHGLMPALARVAGPGRAAAARLRTASAAGAAG